MDTGYKMLRVNRPLHFLGFQVDKMILNINISLSISHRPYTDQPTVCRSQHYPVMLKYKVQSSILHRIRPAYGTNFDPKSALQCLKNDSLWSWAGFGRFSL